jgi:chorismate mutase
VKSNAHRDELRKAIDELDRDIWRRLSARAVLVRTIQRQKREDGTPARDEARDLVVEERAVELSARLEGYPEAVVRQIVEVLLAASEELA